MHCVSELITKWSIEFVPPACNDRAGPAPIFRDNGERASSIGNRPTASEPIDGRDDIINKVADRSS